MITSSRWTGWLCTRASQVEADAGTACAVVVCAITMDWRFALGGVVPVRCTNANRLDDVCACERTLIVAVEGPQQERLHACCCMMPADTSALREGPQQERLHACCCMMPADTSALRKGPQQERMHACCCMMPADTSALREGPQQ